MFPKNNIHQIFHCYQFQLFLSFFALLSNQNNIIQQNQLNMQGFFIPVIVKQSGPFS